MSRQPGQSYPLLVGDDFFPPYQAVDGSVDALPVAFGDPLAVGFVLYWVKNSGLIYCPAQPRSADSTNWRRAEVESDLLAVAGIGQQVAQLVVDQVGQDAFAAAL